tara:strand:+ start:2759 stop:2965 length:207 start_codon:yes stop_codon:yes gene_type:complete
MDLTNFDPKKHTGSLPSPCVSICQLDDNQICKGCLRTIEEIINWSDFSEEIKSKVWNSIIVRRKNNNK